MTELTTYIQQKNRRQKIQWTTIAIYFGSILLLLLIQLFSTQWRHLWVWGALLAADVLVLLSAVFYPLFREIPKPGAPELVKPTRPEEKVFVEEVRFVALYYLTIPFFALFTGMGIFMITSDQWEEGLIFLASGAFFITIAILFDLLAITSDGEHIEISLGPIREKVEISDISSIRPTAVRPFREFLGFGKRIGTDGSIGYIFPLKTGVRIERDGGRPLVITMHRTQDFSNFIRYHMIQSPTG